MNKFFTSKLHYLILTVLLTTSFTTHSFSLKPAPVVSVSDEAGVNVLSGLPSFTQTDLQIGNGVSKLSHTIASYDTGLFWGFRDNYRFSVSRSGDSRYTAARGHNSQEFRGSDANGFSPVDNGSATLTLINEKYEYIADDGTRLFDNELTYPNGFSVKVHYDSTVWLPNSVPITRILSVTTNTGLQLKYNYDLNSFPANFSCDYPYTAESCNAIKDYGLPSSIKAINNAVEYCSPSADSCTISNSWPTADYNWPSYASMFAANNQDTTHGVFTVTDANGATTSYKHKKFPRTNQCEGGSPPRDIEGNTPYVTRLIEIKDATSASAITRKYTYADFAQITSYYGSTSSCDTKTMLINEVDINGAKWTYNHIQPTTQYRSTGRSIGPKGSTSVLMGHYGGTVTRRINASTPKLYAQFTESDRNLIHTLNIDGQEFKYKYDTRNNLIERRQINLDNTNIDDLIEKAGYSEDCDNIKICNQPLWTKDARGNQTDYTYHAASGQVSTITGPADKNNIRPQTRHTYNQKYAYYKNSSGTITKANSGVWLLTKTSECMTGNPNQSGGCASSSDEITTQYYYGEANAANNLWLKGVSVTANGETRVTCYAYDNFGNKISETLPRANTSFTSCQ